MAEKRLRNARPAENDRFTPPEEGFDPGVFAVAGADEGCLIGRHGSPQRWD